MHPVLSVFKCITRHASFLKNEVICAQVAHIRKLILHYPPTRAPSRANLTWLFLYEEKLRRLCLSEVNLKDVLAHWDLIKSVSKDDTRQLSGLPTCAGENRPKERNQHGKHHLWLLSKERRFDAYNSPPAPGSYEYRAVQRKATLANTVARFMQNQKLSVGDCNRAVVEAVLAPHWWQAQRSSRTVLKPRRVDLVSVRRRMGILSLVRVNGMHQHRKGFRKIMALAEKDLYAVSAALDDQLEIAALYARDPFDGDDMSEWIGHLRSARQQVQRRISAVIDKLDISRRVLYMRRERTQAFWDFVHQRMLEKRARDRTLNPPQPLTLRNL